MQTTKASVTCPHCGQEHMRDAVSSIQVDLQPEMREKVQDFSCFRWTCPNCDVVSLVIAPCLYHDVANAFMVWLAPDGSNPVQQQIEQLQDYTLRYVDDLNSFREKITILEAGFDDRAIEIMKYLLFMQLKTDLDVVELVFHGLDERTMDFRFVAVLSDGAEQYVAMPATVYQHVMMDVRERVQMAQQKFVCVDLVWAEQTLASLREGF